jgi:hypothetical protein
MTFQRNCPYCVFETTATSFLMDMDNEFQSHMRTAHLEDGKYEEYLTGTLEVDPEEAAQTVADAPNLENPPE